jgi:phage-related protein
MTLIRQVVAYKSYFLDFYENQTLRVQSKIEWTIQLIRTTRRVPDKYLKHLQGTQGLYEIRVEVGSDIYRIFCFFDEGNLVVLGNGFQKKSQKTPRAEIQRALEIKKEYENEQKDEE